MTRNYKDGVAFQIFTYFFSVIFFDTSLHRDSPCAGYVALSGLVVMTLKIHKYFVLVFLFALFSGFERNFLFNIGRCHKIYKNPQNEHPTLYALYGKNKKNVLLQ